MTRDRGLRIRAALSALLLLFLFGGLAHSAAPNRIRRRIGAVVFSPAQLPGVQAWLRADSLGLADGTAAATWTDLTGKGNSPTQATGAKQPIYKANIVNGRGVLRFASASAQLLALSNYAGGTISQPNTIFVVAAQTGGAAARTVVDSANGSNRNSSDYRATGQMSMFAGGSAVVGATVVGSTFHIYSFLYNGASSQFWLDGLSDATGNPGSNAMQGLQVGLNGALAGSTLDGDVAEVIVCNGNLGTGLRRQTEAFLSAYYKLAVQ